MSTISSRITEARKAKGLTMTALAEALSVTVSGVYLWERGRSKPRPKMLMALAAVLDADPQYLEFGDETIPGEGLAEDVSSTLAVILAAAKAEIAVVTGMPPSAIKLYLNFIA